MAKKSTTTETKTIVEDVKTDVVKSTKQRIIIAKTSTPFRKTISLENKQIIGQMPVGIAYEIVKECNSKIYGDFYQLNNGYYVTKNGNYSIS